MNINYGDGLTATDAPGWALPLHKDAESKKDRPEKPSTDRLSDVSGQQIPILGCYMGWNDSPTAWTAEHFREMADAGFTIRVADNHPTLIETLFPSLDVAASANIRLIINPRVFDLLSAADISRMKEHPGLFGYYIADEPRSVDEFPELISRIRQVQSFDSVHPCYINLASCLYRPDTVPNTWAPELTCGPEWSEPSPCVRFLRKFIEEAPVPVLSFDMYPIWLNTHTLERELQVEWYYTLELMSSEAKKAGKPLCAHVLSSGLKNFEFPHPYPTLNDMRLQAYSNLAYGAQYIQYFTYEYISGWQGPINEKGQPTTAYYTIKAMNREIKALSPVFLNAEMLWTAHTGEIPFGCRELNQSDLPDVFTSLNITGGKGALVSRMKKGEDNFLVIVNHDINEEINVQAVGSKALRRVKKDGTVVIADKRIHRLTPGDALIYFWK